MPEAPDLSKVRLHVVTGKGGTGKTTVAAALALGLTRQGKRVLLAEVEDSGEAHDPAYAVGPRLRRGPGHQLAAGGVADEHPGLVEIGVAADRGDAVRDVVRGARPPATGHAGAAVLEDGRRVAGVGEGLRLAAGVTAVVLRPPEPAVDDHDRQPARDALRKAHVVDLGGVVAVGRRAGRRAGPLVEHLDRVTGHAAILPVVARLQPMNLNPITPCLP